MAKDIVEIPSRVYFYKSGTKVPSILKLQKIGAGHDGFVFRYDQKALKVLKYDIRTREEKGLMTFEKALYFQDELKLKRILKPDGILLDHDGIYSGYSMPYKENVQDENDIISSEFTCQDFVTASHELEEDFQKLTEKKTVAKDINRGSYIIAKDFLYLCDTDKYFILDKTTSPLNIGVENRKACYFALSKFLFYEMLKLVSKTKANQKQLSLWVKKSSNSANFLTTTYHEMGQDLKQPISEYTQYKVKQLLH